MKTRSLMLIALFMLCWYPVIAQTQMPHPNQPKDAPKDWLGQSVTVAAKPTDPAGTCIPYARYKQYVKVEGDDWGDAHPDCVPDDIVMKMFHDSLIQYRQLEADYNKLDANFRGLEKDIERYERVTEETMRALSAVPPRSIVFPPYQPTYLPSPSTVDCTSASPGDGRITTTHCTDY